MIYLDQPDGLIGDFLGTIPAMIHYAKQDDVEVKIHPEARQLLKLIPKKYDIKEFDGRVVAKTAYKELHYFDVSKAFALAQEKGLYMSQAHFGVLGLPIPEVPPKAELEFPETRWPRVDYIISPFARSLPPEQKWSIENWQQLINELPEYEFAVVGSSLHDEKGQLTGKNVLEYYDHPFVDVCNLFKNSEHGLISVITGTSHLAFHLGVKNYLLNNQGKYWGVNPDAINITDEIPYLKPEDVIKVLDDGRNNPDL